MAFWSWKGAILFSALVDSALPGSHEDASLFWTSASLPANVPSPTNATSQKPRTSHWATLPVSLPAIWRCMCPLHQPGPTGRHRVYVDTDSGDRRNSSGPDRIVEHNLDGAADMLATLRANGPPRLVPWHPRRFSPTAPRS